MAPTSAPHKEKQNTQKLRLVHFKNSRPNNCNRSPGASCPKSHPEQRREPQAAPKAAPPENYENMLLFYLTKLKNLFSNNHPQPAARENSALRMNKLQHEHYLRNSRRPHSVTHPYRYTSSNSPKPRDEDIKSKVYKVVSAALEYGFANDVLEKRGDYFALKNRRFRMARQSTPGPRYCERCCNVHQWIKEKPEDYQPSFSERFRPMSSYCEQRLHDIEEGKVDRNYRERSHGICSYRHSPIPYHTRPPMRKPEDPRKQGALKPRIHHCPDCRALERVRK